MRQHRRGALMAQIRAVVASGWPDDCVIFIGRKQPNGYGRVSVDGKYRRAHVVACEMAHGPRPADKTDCAHSCGEPMCINPTHLRWATRKENEADKIDHGRTLRGENSPNAKLTRCEVAAIRRTYAGGEATQQSLADTYGVHIMTINSIVLRRTWRQAA